MIRIVGANPAMDRISIWQPIRLGDVNRSSQGFVVPGGKGFNVARAVVRLGGTAAAHGFLGGRVGQMLREMIAVDGVIDRLTSIEAGTRVCFIVVEPELSRSTVLNEPGPHVTEEETQRLLSDLRRDCGPGDIVVLSGSLPDSVAASVAGEIIAIGNRAGARTVADIHSEALRVAAAAGPWMVKCNRDELLGLLAGRAPDADALARHRAQSLASLAGEMLEVHQRGIEVVVVTLGSEGALLADREGVLHAVVPQVEVVNATGSGDLLLAGLVAAIERGQTARAAIVLGAACGTAGATQLPPELPPDFDPGRWTSRICVETVEPAA